MQFLMTHINIIICILVLIIAYIALNRKYLTTNFEHFHSVMLPQMFTRPYFFNYFRQEPIYYDIRGQPNVVYIADHNGNKSHFGYRFANHIYDTQGNHIKVNNSFYVS